QVTEDQGEPREVVERRRDALRPIQALPQPQALEQASTRATRLAQFLQRRAEPFERLGANGGTVVRAPVLAPHQLQEPLEVTLGLHHVSLRDPVAPQRARQTKPALRLPCLGEAAQTRAEVGVKFPEPREPCALV